eukprot:CAMPEP_0170452732 /NCGR_PEP_ID=MMETSP0123-20130129/1526_1 /TAXON_ID=182087 /ORGANISM="Favella ehrenbergii, Strain Fehren 1" /LENGTH=31 /DNA_ID= /DNA_START= /DNA_END= /DNA_ORIENTATION=
MASLRFIAAMSHKQGLRSSVVASSSVKAVNR